MYLINTDFKDNDRIQLAHNKILYEHGDELPISIKATFIMRIEVLATVKMSNSWYKPTQFHCPETNFDRHFLDRATVGFSREMYAVNSTMS